MQSIGLCGICSFSSCSLGKIQQSDRYNRTYTDFNSWWIASLILHRNDKNWIIPFLLWLAITLRLIFFHLPISIITKPMHFIWNNTGVRFANLIPEKLRVPLGAALVVAVIIIGAMASDEVADNTRANRGVSLFGLVVFIFVLWATSRNRKMIRWHTVSSRLFCPKPHAYASTGHRWHACPIHHCTLCAQD